MIERKKKNFLKAVIVLSVLGIILSGYLVKIHYDDKNSPCDFNETFSCSLVSQSKYAEFFGVPVSLLGLVGYSFLGLIGVGLHKGWERERLGWKKLFGEVFSGEGLLFFSVLSLVFSFYLSYTEFFVIGAICVLCLASQATILGISGYSFRYRSLEKKMGGPRNNGND